MATVTLEKGALYERYAIHELNAGAGSGTYTALIVLSLTNAVAGDIFELPVNFAASVNPTVEVHDATSGGTLLWSLTGDGSAKLVTPCFVYTGAVFKFLRLA